ncbi:TPA: hypothetical protein N8Q04_003571 [Escherichia fergusonii]|nr:hypothetical protein [Escherichia fergusonii]
MLKMVKDFKFKKYIEKLREEGLFFYVSFWFILTLLMEVDDRLPYYLQQDFFFDTLIGFMPINIFFVLICTNIFFNAVHALISPYKCQRVGEKFLSELDKRTQQIGFIISFICFGMSLFCALVWLLFFDMNNESYYAKYTLDFLTVFIIMIMFSSAVNPVRTRTFQKFKESDSHKNSKIFFIIVIITILLPIAYIQNKNKTIEINIKKETYQQIKEKTKMKPEDYIKKLITDIKFN